VVPPVGSITATRSASDVSVHLPVAPGRVRLQHLAVERNGAVERHDHDPLERGDLFLQALDLLIEPTRHARRRRQQQLCLDRIELGDDGLAGEQQIERLGDAAGRGAEDRGDGCWRRRQQDRDRIVLADAAAAEIGLGRLDAAHQMIVREHDRVGIERRAQVDHALGVRCALRAAGDQIEDTRAGGERLLHLRIARGLVGR
jgi:hypothetical protein